MQGTQLTATGKLYIKIYRNCKNRTYKYEPILSHVKEAVMAQREEILKKIVLIQKNDNTAEVEYKKQQIQKQMNVAERALNKLLPLYEEDLISRRQFLERKAQREDEIMQLKQELGKIKEQTPKDKIASYNEVLKQVDYLIQNWQCLNGEGLTDEEVNRSLHFIIERIEWTYGKKDEQPTVRIIYK